MVAKRKQIELLLEKLFDLESRQKYPIPTLLIAFSSKYVESANLKCYNKD